MRPCLFAILVAFIALSGCSTSTSKTNPDCACQTNPCQKNTDEPFPLIVVRGAYAGSALGKLLPENVRLTPAKVLYNLLSFGNQSDAMTWYVGQRPLEFQKIREKKRQENLKANRRAGDVSYTGYIEVLPLYDNDGAVCRVFHQKVTLHTRKDGDLSYKAKGIACRRFPSSWTIVQERQY